MKRKCSGKRFILAHTVVSENIVIVGAGNLATSLAVALKKAGLSPLAVWSRTSESAQALAARVGCGFSTVIEELPQASVVIIAVADAAFHTVARRVALHYPDALVLHTAGSVPMEALRDEGCNCYGVLYPMQTFSKGRIVDFTTVSTFIEGCNDDVALRVQAIAAALGGRVYNANSEQRCFLHLSAVFACNFTNALYAMSAQLLEANGLPFDAMLPLIDETAAKVHTLHPREAQTGPARRGDSAVMQRQASMLSGELLDTYNLISEYIQKNINGK